jgi:3-hexulose-6-phosphate synthase
MQMQVALDRVPTSRAVDLVRAVAPYADWLEVGTSLIKADGMAAVRAVVSAADAVPVLADMKTADDASTEVDMCHAAGARATTVLAIAPDETVRAAVQRTAELEMELVVDLLGTPERRCADLMARYADHHHLVWAGHVGKDDQAAGRFAAGLALLEVPSRDARIALAGGLRLDDVPGLRRAHPGLRLIVGSAITKAERPEHAAAAFRSAIG